MKMKVINLKNEATVYSNDPFSFAGALADMARNIAVNSGQGPAEGTAALALALVLTFKANTGREIDPERLPDNIHDMLDDMWRHTIRLDIREEEHATTH